MESSAQLGTLIRKKRKELKVPQEELSLLSGVSERTLRDLEKGRKTVSFEKVEAVLEVLGLELRVVEQ